MRITIVDYDYSNIEDIKKALEELLDKEGDLREIEINVLGTDKSRRPYLIQEIRQSAPNILLTTNLAGFELCTLTDGISYNLLSCMQLHWIDRISCENEKYLNKILSIAMFFATDNGEIKKYISEKYANVSEMYLESTCNEKSKNIAAGLLRVMKETHLI